MKTATKELTEAQQAEWDRAKSAIRGLRHVVDDDRYELLEDNIVRAQNHKAQGRPHLGLVVLTETARVTLSAAAKSFDTITEETTHE